jgi:hypothetical protein
MNRHDRRATEAQARAASVDKGFEEPARIADHGEWVKWVRQEWFFNDGNSPVSWWDVPSWDWHPAEARIDAVLQAWGLPPLPPRRPKRASSLRASSGRAP